MRSRRVLGALGVVAIVGFVAYGATSFRSNLTPYVSFTQARSSSSAVQVAGQLVTGSETIDTAKGTLGFTIRDERQDTLRVVYRGPVPGNFKEATLVVAVGRFSDGELQAEKVLVKCPSKYQGQERATQGRS